MATSNPSTHSYDAGVENLRLKYEKCKRKSYYKNGRPRPCRSQRCACEECRRKYSEKEAAVLIRSFREKPPDYTFVLKLVDDEPTWDVLLGRYLNAFTQHIRDFRKSDGITFEYDIRIEFKDGQPHAHVTVITPLGWSSTQVKRLVKGWWESSCPGRATLVYADHVKTPVGLAKYVTKDLLDRRGVEMPPQEWNGRKCRLVRRSNGFLARSKKELWEEQCAEWYPQQERLDTVNGEMYADDFDPTEEPESPPERIWRLNQPFIPPLLRIILAAPLWPGNCFCPDEGWRCWAMPRGP